ncbi:MAG: hypothetical protein LBC92_04400 [Rickettsiales bacterium]|jgi:hypothetical protein|nr:hypothetical protein [Rickettsiales bacterium]
MTDDKYREEFDKAWERSWAKGEAFYIPRKVSITMVPTSSSGFDFLRPLSNKSHNFYNPGIATENFKIDKRRDKANCRRYFTSIIDDFFTVNKLSRGITHRILSSCCKFENTIDENKEKVEEVLSGVNDLSELKKTANYLDGVYDGNVNNKEKAIEDDGGNSFTIGEFFKNVYGIDVAARVQERIEQVQQQELTRRAMASVPLDDSKFMVERSVAENVKNGENSIGEIVAGKIDSSVLNESRLYNDDSHLKIKTMLFNLKEALKTNREFNINPKEINVEDVVNEAIDECEYESEGKLNDIEQLEEIKQFLDGGSLSDRNGKPFNILIKDEIENNFTLNEFIKEFYNADVCAILQTRIETLKQQTENQSSQQIIQQQEKNVLLSPRDSIGQVEKLNDKRSNNKEEREGRM